MKKTSPPATQPSLEQVQKHMFEYMFFSGTMALFAELLSALGIIKEEKPSPLSGFTLAYVSCVERDVLYIYGYINRATDELKVGYVLEYPTVRHRLFAEKAQNPMDEANVLIAYGRLIQIGIDKAYEAFDTYMPVEQAEASIRREIVRLNEPLPKKKGVLKSIWSILTKQSK